MNLKPFLVTFVFVFYFTSLTAQVPTKYSDNLVDFREVTINVDEFKNTLQNTQLKGTAYQNKNSNTIIELPHPKGGSQRYRVVEAPILSPELSVNRPDIKSYVAKGIDDPTAIARFNITAAGFYGLIKNVNGISVIEKIDSNKYITYYDHDIINNLGEFDCESDEESEPTSFTPINSRLDSCFQIGDNLRSYELVLTCSGEFYALNGGTDPLVEAALINRIAQVNTVYETEVATTFTIVEFLLNDNPATDPYSDPTNTFTSITETENYINSNATVSSWDIGHGFHEITCGGGCGWAGRAGLAVVCTSGKARGYTYLPNDIPTAINVLVHEFGHQFSNRHTNYGCNSNNACSRYEPGQGSTIMSTGAGCDAGDFFANRTDYFSVASLQNMIDYMNSGLFVTGTSCGTVAIGGWSDCATLIPTGNSMPSSDANINNINGLVIPHSTPFVLNGSGSDADGTGSLTYNWEQYDTDYSDSDAPDDTASSTTAPLFRSFPPSTSNERTVPTLSSILAGNITAGTGEILPTVARNLTWRLTVRDNEIGGGGVACDQITLTVGSDGPFQITSQNSTTAWFAGDTETITWDVANTDNAAYTCANIDILYSTDGGNTFPTTLASSVPNNGSANITVPGVATNSGRIKIVCSGGTNIFFDINNIDISIVSSCGPVAGVIANNASVIADEGDPSLNLDLLSGLPINSFAGVLDASDANTNLSVENNGSGTCIFFGNTPKYETIELATGSDSSVTFTRTSQGDYNSMIGLFEGNYNPGSVCDNWLNSNGNFSGSSSVNISSGFAEPLVTGTTYVLLASGFSSTTPSVGNYNVNFSQTLYDVGALNIPGYIYTYVIVNDSSGNIIAFDLGTDLSNAATYSAGSYSIYGLSYLASENLSVYVGNPLTNLQSDISSSTICGAFSANNVAVNITGDLPTVYTYNSGTWLPSNPIGVALTTDIINVETGNATITANTDCNQLTVNAGAGLTINSGVTLTVSNSLNLESNSLSYSSLILDGTVSGTINYERHVNINGSGETGSNDLISAPLTGQEFDDFALANPNILNNGTLYLFGPFDKITGDYITYNGSATTTLDAGIGYRAASSDNGTFTFTGTANNGTVINNIINSGPTEPADSEWNLIGNPYPSYLNVQAFLNHEVSIGVKNINLMNSGTAAIYGYDGNAVDGWVIFNLANTSASTLIAPGQGFFVSADPTNVPLFDLEFTPAMRSTGNSDDFILGRYPNNTNSVLSKLMLSSSTDTSNTNIYFIEGTTRGLDHGYDASVFQGKAGDFSIFTNLIEDNQGIDYAIQSLPYDDLDDVIVPLGIHAKAGNILTISLDDNFSLPANIFVYLEDTLNHKITLLNSSDYRFTPTNDLTGTGRFFLRYSSDSKAVSISELDNMMIYADNINDNIVIKGQLSEKSNAILYDIHGRIIMSHELDVTNSINNMNISKLNSGVYIVKVSNKNMTKTQKLIIQ